MDQETLRAFYERRHPDYSLLVNHWEFLLATYKGGRSWFEENIHRYLKEGDKEFTDRLLRAYRFNHTREAVDLVNKYIFKQPAARNETDAPAEIKRFWENVTLSNLDIDQFMKIVSTQSSTLGMPWIFTDTTKRGDVVSIADEAESGARIYAYVVNPQDILDVGFNDQGDRVWVKVRERYRDDKDPIESSGEMRERVRLWTLTNWTLFEERKRQVGGKEEVLIEIVDFGVHDLGRLPGFPVPHTLGDNRYSSPSLIDDIAYLDRAVANYLSNLDAIIQDQTFSQLAMPSQAILPGDDKYNALIEAGTKRIFTYDGEGGAEPHYISPDPKQAGVILSVISKIINEIYHSIGMAGERTKEDNAVGVDNSSGVAKAYDFERVNSLLTSKASTLENAENELVSLVMVWSGKALPKQELVKYPESFDVRNLFDEFTVAEKLALIDAPDAVRREQMNQVVAKLFPRISADLLARMKKEIEDWPRDPVEMAGALAEAKRPPTQFGQRTASRSISTGNRQGEVTAATE